MTVKELQELLNKFPADAEIFIGYTEGEKSDKPGFMLFNIWLTHLEETWSYGNSTHRPPSKHENVVVIEVD